MILLQEYTRPNRDKRLRALITVIMSNCKDAAYWLT
jgi:hypothetical protein